MRWIRIITISLFLFISIISFIVSFQIFKVLHENTIEISEIMGEKIFIIYYLILLFYLVGSSFKEAYTRAFQSKDYYYLRLQKISPFVLQVAKVIDAYFLEIMLLILPLHLGLSLSFIFVFDFISLWNWVGIFLLVTMFSLALRILLMLILFNIDRRSYKKRNLFFNSFKIIFWMLLGWGISFIVAQYIIHKEWFFSFVNTVMSGNLPYNFPNYIWLIGGFLTALLFILEFTYLHFTQQKIDTYRMGEKVRKKQTTLNLGSSLITLKSKSKYVTLLIKDLLLLTRGEYLSLGFLKANIILLSCFLGVISALSISFSDSKYEGIMFLAIIIFQIISNELVLQSISKLSSIELERNWLKFYYSHMKNPYFIYFSKFILQFSISFGTLLVSTIVILILMKISVKIIFLALLSSICIPLISSLSFLIGNVCFPNFKWETQDQINTSIYGYIMENISAKLYQVLLISIVGTNTAFLYMQKTTTYDFFIHTVTTFTISTGVWGFIIFFILRAPLWKGWKF